MGIVINGKITNAKEFAYDGCHKIYLLNSQEQVDEAISYEYEILPIDCIESTYENSCDLKFISNWGTFESYVEQFEPALFGYDGGRFTTDDLTRAFEKYKGMTGWRKLDAEGIIESFIRFVDKEA